MQAGTAAWADGLEKVCELIFRVETLEGGKAVQASKGRAKDEDFREGAGVGSEVGYEHFLSDPAPQGRTVPTSGPQSNFLVELVQMLGARLLACAQTSDDTDDVAADADSWRYWEEAEKDSAETGESVIPDQAEAPDVKLRLHRQLGLGYLRLMEALARRVELLRDEKRVAGRDELLRFHIVATLVLQATGREVEDAGPCRPLVQPQDLGDKMLPSVAILLGRSPNARPAPDGSDGPVLLRAKGTLTDPDGKEAACVIAVLLSALVTHQRQRAQGRIRCAEDKGGAGSCPELVAARSFTTLEKLGLLPTPDTFEGSVQLFGLRSPWVSSLGESGIVAVFHDLVGRSRRIIELENGFMQESPPPPPYSLDPGVWVYTLSSGVTEVVGLECEKVVVAIIGGPGTDALSLMTVSWPYVRLTGMRRSC
jgi:hypothetical protein